MAVICEDPIPLIDIWLIIISAIFGAPEKYLNPPDLFEVGGGIGKSASIINLSGMSKLVNKVDPCTTFTTTVFDIAGLKELLIFTLHYCLF